MHHKDSARLRTYLNDKMERKALGFEVSAEVEWEELNRRFPELIAEITIIQDDYLYGFKVTELHRPVTLDFVIPDVPQWFILVTDLGSFLVNTEGYSYCRYITNIR